MAKRWTLYHPPGTRTIEVRDGEGWQDNAVVYEDGTVGFDWPEAIPVYVKRQVFELARGVARNRRVAI